MDTENVTAPEGEGMIEPVEPAQESMEALLAQQATLGQKLSERKVAWVKVIQVTKEAVLVDIGEKREGSIPVTEWTQPGHGRAPESLPAAGQRIPVILVGAIRGDRPSALSYRRAKTDLAWEAVSKAHAEKARVRGRVAAAIKGGFLVDVGGVSAFLPASLADLRPVRQPEKMVGTGVRCVIIEVNEAKKQIVLSRRAVLEEETTKRRAQILAELRVGEIRIGRIVHISPAGLIVDVGGAEGFVKPADVAWGAPKAPEGFERGQKIRVKVMAKPEKEGDRIPLGIKQLKPNPSEALRRKYPPKAVVRVKVVEVVANGVKLALVDGAPAFCGASELEEGAAYKAGDSLSAIVLGVNSETFDVTVSINKFADIQERKRMAQYLKAPAPLTLGQLLKRED